MAWEALSVNQIPIHDNLAFPILAFTAGIFDVRYVVLMPHNVTRGAVTLVRIRGNVVMYLESAIIALVGGDTSALVAATIQLVPIKDNAIVDNAVANPLSSVDLESNAILWRRTYTPDLSNSVSGAVIDGERYWATHEEHELDVKVKRRFDRANWALIMAIAVDTDAAVLHRTALDIRALFLAPDGL